MKRFGIFAVALVMAFTGVMSFMPGAAAYDGGLPQAENEVLLTLEIISDTHIGADGTEAVLNTAVDTFNAESAVTDGIIAAGDLTDSGSDDEFARFYGIIGRYEKGKMAVANGNHDYFTTIAEGGGNRPVRYRNEYLGEQYGRDFYSTEINGYKVILLGNDSPSRTSDCIITDSQIELLKAELEDGAAGGKPVFVVTHWPLQGTNGESLLWPIIPGGNVKKDASSKIKAVLEQYDNIFVISGHTHLGFPGNLLRFFGINCVEEKNGVTYISVPSIGKGSRHGVRDAGVGWHAVLTKDRLTLTARSYLTGQWYDNYTYTVAVSNYSPAQAETEDADIPPEAAPVIARDEPEAA